MLEILIVMALTMILMGLVSAFLLQVYAVNRQMSVNRLVRNDLRFAADYIARELREAVSIAGISDGGRRINYVAIIEGQPANRYFRQNGSTIQRHDNQPLCQYVKELRFSFDPASCLVTLYVEGLTTPATRGGTPAPYVLHTSVVLRNQPR